MGRRWWGTAWAIAIQEPAGVAPKPIHWNVVSRCIFRFTFCYYIVWVTLNGNATVWEAIPGIGRSIQSALWQPLGICAQWIGRTVFHLHGQDAHWISRGVSDSLLTLVLTGCYILVAFTGAVVWTLLDRRRTEYQTLLAWMRFLLRLTVGIGLVSYGLGKILPGGDRAIDQAALHAQLGSLPPAMVLWTVSKASRGLQITEGACELLAGIMLLYRRSALFGALMTFFAIGAVLAVEIYFHMPVRIFTGHLMLADGSIILPDLAAVVTFFWSHQWSAPSGVWIEPIERRRYLRWTAFIEIVLVALVVSQVVAAASSRIDSERLARRQPLPYLGGWQVERDAQIGSAPGLDSKAGNRIASVWFNRQIDADQFQITLESADGHLWQGTSIVDPALHTLMLRGRYSAPRTYQLRWSGDNTILLHAMPAPGQAPFADERLTRIPADTHYRLLEKKSQMVDTYGYSR